MDFRLLGPLEVAGQSGPVHLAKRQQRLVLTALLLRAGALVPTDSLVESLWPDAQPPGARESLHSHIARLRQSIEPNHSRRGPPERLLTARPGYRLVVERGELDVYRFEANAVRGRAALGAGRTEEGVELLGQALEEWRGPAVAEFRDAPFAALAAHRLEQARIDVLEARLGAELDVGGTDVIGELEALVHEHPLRERLWEHLLLALYRGGRQTEALRRGEEIRRLLADSGLEPGAALTSLNTAILRQEPSLLRPAGPSTPVGQTGASVAAGEPAMIRLDEVSVTPPGPWPPHDLPLIGRTAEVERFEQVWRLGSTAPPTLVLLNGEPGAGKTRLSHDLLRRAHGDGALVLTGRCSPQPLVPHEPLVSALGALLEAAPDPALDGLGHHRDHLARLLPDVESRPPEAVESGDPDVARYLAYQAVVQLLRVAGSGRRVLLGIDDLQWGEAGTFHLLSHLLHAGLGGLVVLATNRSTEVGDDHPLPDFVGQVGRDLSVVEIEVGGLSEAEVGELIHRSQGFKPSDPLAAAVHAGTSGNALFVREVVRNVAGWKPGQPLDFPDSVRALVRQRVDHLQPATRELVEAAAVLGSGGVDVALLSTVVGQPPADVVDGLEPARRAGLLTRTPGGSLVFNHEVTRSAIERDLPLGRRARLHRRAGEALVARHRDLEPLLDRLADHFFRAADDGDAARAAQFAERAGHRALAMLAYEGAAQRFEAGLDALDRTGDQDDAIRLRLALGRQTAHRRAGNASVELEQALDTVALARSIGTPAQVAEAAVGLSSLGWRDAGAGEVVAGALADVLADVTVDPCAEVEVLGELALVSAVLDRHDETVALCRRIQQRLDQIDDDEAFVAAVTSTVYLLVNEEPLDRRAALVEAARARAERGGSLEAQTVVWATTRYQCWEGQDTEGADAAGRAYEALVDRLRMPRYLAGRAQRRAMLALLHGDFPAAEELAQEMLDRQPHREFLEGFVAQIFAVRAEQGRLSEVVTTIDDLGLGDLVAWRGAKALCLTEADDLEGARRHLQPYWEQAMTLPRNATWLAGAVTVAMATVWVDERAGAECMYRLLEPEADRVVIVGMGAVCLGVTARVLGPLALLTGDLDAAESWCRRSLQVHQKLGALPFQVTDRLWLAEALDRLGGGDRRDEALRLRQAAVADADRLLMAGRLLDQAQHAMSGHGTG